MDLSNFEPLFAEFIQQQQIHDAAHDLNHIKRVVKSAKLIAQQEGANLEIVVPAAWLHDCVSFPKNHPDNKRASVCAAEKAIEFLGTIHYPSVHYDAIYHAICAHSYSAKIPTETLEAQVVQDADRLDGLGAIGVSRCMLVAGKLDSKIYNNTDPFCENRPADSKIAAVDHFYEKLFKTAETMQTQAGKDEANRRVVFMKSFLNQLNTEIG